MDDSLRLGFGARFPLAWVCFFRVLFDGAFAARAAEAAQPPQALPAKPEPEPEPERPSPADDGSAALRLLALLQREGRLVDFLQQDIAAHPDAEIGAAARVVHEGCRKALRGHVDIQPVRTEDEGSRVRVEPGFDPSGLKLSGDVKGQGPYEGVLRHRGWRAGELKLPVPVKGHDPSVLCPAEVEL